MKKEKERLPKEGSVQVGENGDIIGRVVYKYEKGIFGRFKRPKIDYDPPTERKLYLMTEVVKIGIVQYLRNSKMEVAMLSSEVDDFLTTTMFETEPSRLVILDYGRGTFLDNEKVELVLGLIEAFSDIGTVTVFSNTASFKTAITRKFRGRKEILDKIDMHKYKGAVYIYEVLRDKNEVYKVGGAIDIQPEEVMKFRGEKVQFSTQQLEARDAMRVVANSLKRVELLTEEEVDRAEDGVPAF